MKKLKLSNNYKDAEDSKLDNEKYEWKESQQKIFPPNYIETGEFEEIIQYEEHSVSESNINSNTQNSYANRPALKVENSEIKPICDGSVNMYSDDNNTNKHISKSEDSILNLATIDNPLHNSPLLKYNSKYDFDKRILFR